MVWSYRKNARHRNSKKKKKRKKMYGSCMQQDEEEDQKMRWLDDVSTDLRKMGINEWRGSKESRGLEAYCKGGQGLVRAVGPPKKKMHKRIVLK
jgi:glutathionylspermidine synthase